MKAQAGQIALPDLKAGVNLLQEAVVLILIGIMAAVIADLPVLTTVEAGHHPAINARG